MTRVLIAPDKFKGSLTATEVAEAVRRGLVAAAVRPGPVATAGDDADELDIHGLPVADGGDGTLDAAVAAGFERVTTTATGPTGDPVATAWARKGDTAVVEMADVSGLVRLPGGRLEPMTATSRGTGELIVAALDAGVQRVVLGIGGSACTDGGAGVVQALGGRLLDPDGHELAQGGGALADLHSLDLSGLPERLAEVEFVVACDVDNPLTGPTGAAAVYGPQKGADEAQVRALDDGLTRFADLVAEGTGGDVRDTPGAGAAGGVGFAALAVLGATLRPGIDLMLELLDFERHLEGVDVVVVGEGSLDRQTLHGKAPVGVARMAHAAGARVVAVCGVRRLGDDELRAAGIDAAYALTDIEPDPERCMTDAAALLERVARESLAGHVSSR